MDPTDEEIDLIVNDICDDVESRPRIPWIKKWNGYDSAVINRCLMIFSYAIRQKIIAKLEARLMAGMTPYERNVAIHGPPSLPPAL
jgi:hypothetical protein